VVSYQTGNRCGPDPGNASYRHLEEMYDKVFVEKYCHGFDKLKEHVKAYPPENNRRDYLAVCGAD